MHTTRLKILGQYYVVEDVDYISQTRLDYHVQVLHMSL